MSFRQRLYDRFMDSVNERIELLRGVLNDLKDSSSNETKSTAGDKHETALAMLQIEQKNTSIQLKEALDQRNMLEQLRNIPSGRTVARGSVVETDRGYLFISLALGKIIIDGITVMAISPASPLGSKLLGVSLNETVVVNGTGYLVRSIL